MTLPLPRVLFAAPRQPDDSDDPADLPKDVQSLVEVYTDGHLAGCLHRFGSRFWAPSFRLRDALCLEGDVHDGTDGLPNMMRLLDNHVMTECA